MAIPTVDSSDTVHVDSIPVVDLRFFSQSELNTLSLCSGDASDVHRRRSDDLFVPKIDRSVFNESAGSRKQTYSRLRLAPHPSDSSPVAGGARRRRRLLSEPPPSDPVNDSERIENRRIVQFLRALFNTGNNNTLPDWCASAETTVQDDRPIACSENPNFYGNPELYNRNGNLVDLEALERKEDLFGEELRRRTGGMRTEAELLEFLSGLNGTWASRRKKKKIVAADDFGDDLPRGWKISLGIRKRGPRVWMYCRRFISPSGQQFASCQGVASYLHLFIGTQDERPTILNQINTISHTIPNAATRNRHAGAIHEDGLTLIREVPVHYAAVPISSIGTTNRSQQVVLSRLENPAEVHLQNCQKCDLTFDDEDTYVQHLLSVHHRHAKRIRLGKSVAEGVILNGGKYGCQFCPESFDDRHQYKGHLGMHRKTYQKNPEVIPDETIAQNGSVPSVLLALPAPSFNIFSEKGISSVPEIFTGKPLNVVFPHARQEDGGSENVEGQKCGPLVAINESSTTKCSKTSNNAMDLDSVRNLDHVTLVPDISEVNGRVIGEGKLWFEIGNNVMDVDSNLGSKNATPLPTNKKMVYKMAEDKPVNVVNFGANTMDVDSYPNMIDEVRLPTIDQNGQEITGDKSEFCLEASSNLVDIDANPRLKDGLLSINKENLTDDVSYVEDNQIDDTRNQKDTHHDKKQSGEAETCGDICFSKGAMLDETKIIQKGENDLKSCFATLPYYDEQMISAYTESPTNDTNDSKLENSMIDEAGEFGNEMEIGLLSSYSGPVKVEVVAEIGRCVIEEGSFESAMTSTTTPLVLPSDFLPCIDLVSNKGDVELSSVSQKQETMPGFEELRLEDMRTLKFDLGAGQESCSLPDASIDLAGGVELEQELKLPTQFEWTTNLPKMVAPQQSMPTMCVWCRIEFKHDSVNPDPQTDSVGFMCPTCKAKISGQLCGLDDDVSV